jgi:circadian clock protein KaiC
MSSAMERIPTGIDGLDVVLNGGLLRGAAYIIQGPPGAGKTILSNQICFKHTDRGETALYMSLLAESHDRMMRYMQQMGFYSHDKVPRLLTYLSAYSTLEKEGLRGVIRLLSQEVRRSKASLVILDGLFVIHDVAGSEHEFRTFVHELQGQASLLGITLLVLTNQQREPSSPEFTMVDGWMELRDLSHSLRSVRSLTVHKQRGGSFLRGEHLFRLEATPVPSDDHEEATGRASAGLEALDTMLHGGYPAASATLLLGPTGSGKTSLGLHFLSKCTVDEPGVLYGFYERPKRLMLKARSIGIDLASLVEAGALTVRWRSPAENLVDELGHELIELVDTTKARRIFVDGLSAFRDSLIHKQRLTLFVNALNQHLRSRGAAVIWTLESKELFLPEHLPAEQDISAISDNVVLVHYALRDGILRRNLSILKVRDSDFDPISEEFFIGSVGIQFGEPDLERLRPKGAVPDLTTEESTQRGVTRRTGKKGR